MTDRLKMVTIRRKNMPMPTILVQTEPTFQNSMSDTSSSDEDGMQPIIQSDGNSPYSAKLIFKPQETSDFEARHVEMISGLSITIGRGSSSNEGPSLTNMIFDSKVMSKSHADIWYDHMGAKFYIKDRNSSNGTYLNIQHEGKISKTGKPYISKLSRSKREIYHGDALQLGVNIVEDNGLAKMSYACVRGIVHLYLPDGTEAMKNWLWEWPDKLCVNSNFTYYQTPNPNLKEIHILKTILQEAVHREHRMNEKLKRLTTMLQVNGVQCKKMWKSVINEVLINDYVEALCRERNILEKSLPPESLERTVSQLLREKLACQELARHTVKDLMNAFVAKITELRQTKNEVQQLEEKFALCQSLCEEKSNVADNLLEENEDLKKRLKLSETVIKEKNSKTVLVSTNEAADSGSLPVSTGDQERERRSPRSMTDYEIPNYEEDECYTTVFPVNWEREFNQENQGNLINDNEVLFENVDPGKIGGNGDSNFELLPDDTKFLHTGSPKENTMSLLEMKSYLTEIQQQCKETLDVCIFEDVCDQVIKLISKMKTNVDKIENACRADAAIIKSPEKEAFTGIDNENCVLPINVADETEQENVSESPGSTNKMATSEDGDFGDFQNNSDYQEMEIFDQNVFPETSVSQDLEVEQLLKHFHRSSTHDHQVLTVAEGKNSWAKECGIIFAIVVAILMAVWSATLNL